MSTLKLNPWEEGLVMACEMSQEATTLAGYEVRVTAEWAEEINAVTWAD